MVLTCGTPAPVLAQRHVPFAALAGSQHHGQRILRLRITGRSDAFKAPGGFVQVTVDALAGFMDPGQTGLGLPVAGICRFAVNSRRFRMPGADAQSIGLLEAGLVAGRLLQCDQGRQRLLVTALGCQCQVEARLFNVPG